MAEITGFRAIPGHGVRASAGGHQVLLGNQRLLQRQGIDGGWLAQGWQQLAADGKTSMYVAVDGQAAPGWWRSRTRSRTIRSPRSRS